MNSNNNNNHEVIEMELKLHCADKQDQHWEKMLGYECWDGIVCNSNIHHDPALLKKRFSNAISIWILIEIFVVRISKRINLYSVG